MSELQKRLRSMGNKACEEAADALDAKDAEIARLGACRDELREATVAIDDPAVNNLTTLPEAIRALRARVDAALPEKMKERCPCGGFGCDCGNYGDCASAAYASGWNAAIDAARGGA